MSNDRPCPDDCIAHREIDTRVCILEEQNKLLFRKLDRLTWWAMGLLGALTLDILTRLVNVSSGVPHK